MSLLLRRKLILAASASVVPDGYVTDGLVFFLDGKQLATASLWTDIVGGKAFTLTNCTKGTDYIAFDGTSYGLYSGAVSNDWSNETIEVVVSGYPKDADGRTTTLQSMSLLYQPTISNQLGISFRWGNEGQQNRAVIANDGVGRGQRQYNARTYATRIGINANRLIVNGALETASSFSSYGKNTTGNTILGAAQKAANPYAFYTGHIHAIRIYNRKLTEDEIKSNQAKDAVYYNLT